MTIRDIMTADPVFAEPDTTLEEIASLMKQENIGAVPVVEDGEVVGIVTDRDIVLRCIAEGQDPTECTAEDVMSTEVFCIEPDTSTAEAARLMGERQIRRLAVIENGKLVGMVSIGDVAVKSNDDDLSGDTLEDVSQGVKQNAARESSSRKEPRSGNRGKEPRPRGGEQPFESETQNLKGSQTGADRGGLKAGRQRSAKEEPQPQAKRQSQGLKSDSSAKKQGIANRSAKEENERNDKVIPFRGENEIRNTRVQKSGSKRKSG
jgi:CBS domain-containing protein